MSKHFYANLYAMQANNRLAEQRLFPLIDYGISVEHDY